MPLRISVWYEADFQLQFDFAFFHFVTGVDSGEESEANVDDYDVELPDEPKSQPGDIYLSARQAPPDVW
jgi:hypothetical protein